MRVVFLFLALAPGFLWSVCRFLFFESEVEKSFLSDFSNTGLQFVFSLFVVACLYAQAYGFFYMRRNRENSIIRRYKSYGYYDLYVFLIIISFFHVAWTMFLCLSSSVCNFVDCRVFHCLVSGTIFNNIVQVFMILLVVFNMKRKIVIEG